MSQKNQAQLVEEINLLIDTTGKRLTTGSNLKQIFTDLFDSYPNLITQIAVFGLKEYVTTGKSYVVGEGVLRNDELLQCITATSGAFNAAHWKKILTLATESVAGILEIATQGETLSGAVDNRIVTPLKLKQYVDPFLRKITVRIDPPGTQNLNTSPAVLIPKTDGEYTQLVSILARNRFNGAAFTTGDLRVRFKGTVAIVAAFSNAFYIANANYVEGVIPQSTYKSIISEDLELYNDTANDGNGNGIFEFDILYRKIIFA